jgi:hypothetical protein
MRWSSRFRIPPPPIVNDRVESVPIKVVGHVMAILPEGTEKPREHVVKRDVVVSRDDQLRLRQQIEKGPCGPELPRARALSEIARHDEYIGTKIPNRVAQHVGHNRIDPAEMEIREVHERAHYGTMTRRALGRIRNSRGLSNVLTFPSSDSRSRAVPASSVTTEAVSDSKPSSRETSPNMAVMIMRATRRRGMPGAMHT